MHGGSNFQPIFYNVHRFYIDQSEINSVEKLRNASDLKMLELKLLTVE